MERHSHGASFLHTLNNLFRRGQSSSVDEQVDSVQRAGVIHTQFQSSGPIQLDHVDEAMASSGSSASHPHAADGDVQMLLADPLDDTPHSTEHPALITSSSSQLTSLPHTSAFPTSSRPIDLELHGPADHSVMDDDVHSDISMPPLEVESDSEYDEDHIRYGGYDSRSESDVDAYDVEMHLLVDDGDLSDDEGSALPNGSTPPLAPFPAHRNQRHVVVEEVEDQDQQRADTNIPLAESGQPGSSSHTGTHTHWHAYPHPHPNPHPHPFQHPHLPHPPHPDGDVRLPNFPTMPGLRAQGQVEGQIPLPGLRTLFQPLIVEAIAQASERFRTAQGAGGPAGGQGPTMGPAPGTPIVQVTFDVPVFRIPTVGQTRQQPPAEAQSGVDGQRQAEHERAFAAPPSPDNPNPTMLNFTPPTPNPTHATDGMPPVLRQIFEATFEPEPADPTADGPQIGAPPGWAGLMGLLFGLGLGASHELNREDPARAKRLVKGLEVVNTGLVKRMGKIGEGAICAICWDALLGGDAENTPDSATWESLGDATSNPGQPTHPEAEANDSAEPEPEPEPEEPLPKIIALPCSHVFHSACLVPWFSRPKQTTCPTCRFNVDPDNLTYEPPRRPQSNGRQQSQQEPPTPPQPGAPEQGAQEQQESDSGVPPLQPQTAQQQDGHPTHPHLRRTIFEHTFTLPFPLFPTPLFPLAPQHPGNPVPQPQPEVRQQGPGQQGPFPAPAAATDPFPPIAFQRAFHNLRRPFSPHMQPRMHPLPHGAPAQEGPALPQVPLQPQAQPPLPGQGMQSPPEDGQQNTNGMPRFPGLFQFQLPQFGRMPDGTLFWSAPLGGFPTPTNPTAPQASPGPAGPKRAWVPPPPPGLTLRQRVEQGERENGLRCDDMSCGLGPSDDDPEPTADLARVVINSLGDGTSVCGHTFHPSCLVSAERVAGWGPDSESERERAGGLVEVSCPVCRAVGVIPRKDWEQGAQALV